MKLTRPRSMTCCPVGLFILCLCLTLSTARWGIAAAASGTTPAVTEIYSVAGCHREELPGGFAPLPQRTRSCFKGSGANVQLTLRGANFPILAAGEHFEVELLEAESFGGSSSGIPPLTNNDKDVAASSSADNASPGKGKPPNTASPRSTAFSATEASNEYVPIRWLCSRATPSSTFPTQLIHCELRHPTETHWARGNELQRLQERPRWMDVVLYKVSPDLERRAIAIARRVVEVDVSAVLDPKEELSGEEEYGRKATSDTGTSSLYTLEELYTSGDGVWAELGVGGLQKVLHTLFRRVFLSRMPSLSNITSALELQHVRGVILHGRPGTGKTLIARTLTEVLGDSTHLTIVHAADVLSKYVGETEQNLQRIFTQYEMPFEDEADPASAKLHVIVIDELETLFVQRGHHEGSSASLVYEGVTNTLLSMMDGMQSRQDVLVIGITNRLDALDPAMLRPGRFEVVLEVPNPDKEGLEEIFTIHSDALRFNGFLAPDVDTSRIADQLHGLSGADVAGAVRSAVSTALEEHLEQTRQPDGKKRVFLVTAAHFSKGINEVRQSTRLEQGIVEPPPTTTATREPLSELVDHDGSVHHNLERITSMFRTVQRSKGTLFSGISVIQGAAGTGKTTAAQYVYHHPTGFASENSTLRVRHKRYISCRSLLSASLEDSIRVVQEVLHSSVAREEGTTLVVLDDIDVLLDAAISYPLLDTLLMTALHEYMRSPPAAHTKHRTGNELQHGEQSDSKDLPKRLLVLTVSRPFNLRLGLRVDVTADLHTVYRSSLYRLLPFYRILSPDDTETVRTIAPSYPSSVSFAQFLRMTEMALWRLADRELPNFRMPSTFSGEGRRDAEAEPPALTGPEAASAFAAAVRSVSAAMGNVDPFRSVESTAEAAVGESVEEALW